MDRPTPHEPPADDRALDGWAAKIEGWGQDTYVYFDNDAKGYAPHDAERLIARLR